jgi:3-oxoadipate enol-lactonase
MPIRFVFLHGIGGSARGFAPHIEYFKRLGHEAVAMSQPGYDGEAIIEPYQFDALAQSLNRKLSALAPMPTVLVGHSMGGMLAQTFAHLYRKSFPLEGLVLAQTSPAFGYKDGEFQQRFIQSRTALLDAGLSMADVARKLIAEMLRHDAPQTVREQCIAMMAAVPPDTYRAALKALVEFDARSYLAELNLPVLCLAAELDETAPPAVLQKMATKLPQAQFACLPAIGHLAPMEDPLKFCSAIQNFIEKQISSLNEGASL